MHRSRLHESCSMTACRRSNMRCLRFALKAASACFACSSPAMRIDPNTPALLCFVRRVHVSVCRRRSWWLMTGPSRRRPARRRARRYQPHVPDGRRRPPVPLCASLRLCQPLPCHQLPSVFIGIVHIISLCCSGHRGSLHFKRASAHSRPGCLEAPVRTQRTHMPVHRPQGRSSGLRVCGFARTRARHAAPKGLQVQRARGGEQMRWQARGRGRAGKGRRSNTKI